jgi:hypothetical protein
VATTTASGPVVTLPTDPTDTAFSQIIWTNFSGQVTVNGAKHYLDNDPDGTPPGPGAALRRHRVLRPRRPRLRRRPRRRPGQHRRHLHLRPLRHPNRQHRHRRPRRRQPLPAHHRPARPHHRPGQTRHPLERHHHRPLDHHRPHHPTDRPQPGQLEPLRLPGRTVRHGLDRNDRCCNRHRHVRCSYSFHWGVCLVGGPRDSLICVRCKRRQGQLRTVCRELLMMKFLGGLVVFELICLVILVVVTVADRAQPIDRWLIVILPLATALLAIFVKRNSDKRRQER